MQELPKIYNPEETDLKWYQVWEESGYFKPTYKEGAVPFTIVIPPPNVTGSLHMGHALNNTLQDILIRYNRMAGRDALWVPGTDHGGIATQNVVEKLIRNEKKTRHDLGREAFLERMWQWRRESGDTILMQLKRLGASCDWTRTRFTLDEICSKAVKNAFVELFKKGLIYRGNRMVNWCPRCHTALADIEVEHEPTAGKLWHIKYPVAGTKDQFVIVATTRPETLLGDSAVAVNPEDARYTSLKGKNLVLPLVGREIPVIFDSSVDPSFGTGAVKVTPAHDPTDFETGERHNLKHHIVIDFSAKIAPESGLYVGLDRMEARKQLVADLESSGLLEKVENYTLSASTCYRCQTIIEPLMSEQWFLKMKTMAEQAAQATRDGRMKIFPNSWEKPYLLWLDNLKDWCISRQIWWGHRIPIYYCQNSEFRNQKVDKQKTQTFCQPIAAEEMPKVCPNCQSSDLIQDEDVLDTWFSSALWPFSVFGWPNEHADLKRFYPTSVLVTGHEILYLWVARMVMMGLHFMKDVPFRHVFIHGIVRDNKGKKMSKSLGNVIDPLGIMKEFGTDALRFSLANSSIPGRDMQLSNDSFLQARNFTNKIWNASRFLLMNVESPFEAKLPDEKDLALEDKWILEELEITIQNVEKAFEEYRPADACRALYDFIWKTFCDWFLEVSKPTLQQGTDQAKQHKRAVLMVVLKDILVLMHPIMPYQTETIYQTLHAFFPKESPHLMKAQWPKRVLPWKDRIASKRMRSLQLIVESIRNIRSEMNVPLTTKVDCLIRCSDPVWQNLLEDSAIRDWIYFLARVKEMKVSPSLARPPQSATAVFEGGVVFIPLEGLIDIPKERARLQKKLEQAKQQQTKDQTLFDNAGFRSRAPAEEVEMVRERIVASGETAKRLAENIEGLVIS